MNLQLIRNATLKIVYAGKTILVDPMLCKKETMEPFVKGLERNPIVDLTMSPEEVLKDVEAVLVTHSHPDHFDSIAAEMLPKSIPLFSTPTDEAFFADQHFNNVTVVDEETEWAGIRITRIEGQHGSGPILSYMGMVSGYVLQAENEPTVYIISDSILIDNVKGAIGDFEPEVIVTNSGGAFFPGYEDFPVIMDNAQTVEVAQLAPKSNVVAVHLESIDFSRATRKGLREYANGKGISDQQLLIPADGETLTLTK